MTLSEIIAKAINPAHELLPAKMDSVQARVMMLTTGLQESRFEHRRQMGNGPARSFWQFERGGGVKGVMTHAASRDHMQALCVTRRVPFTAQAIWEAIEFDDVLAAGATRLLYWTDPGKLPAVTDAAASWALYLRTWRPGKPHPETWPAYHRTARSALLLP